MVSAMQWPQVWMQAYSAAIDLRFYMCGDTAMADTCAGGEARQTGMATKRRSILATAAAIVAGIVAKQASQPAAALSGGGDQFPLNLGSNPWYKAGFDPQTNPNQPAISSAPTVIQASVNFGNFVGENGADPVVFEIGARPANVGNIDGIYAFARGGGTAMKASGFVGVDATGNGIGVMGTGGVGVVGNGIQEVIGVGGSFGVGVKGQDDAVNGIGVLGQSANGVGGRFEGGLTPLHLAPGAQSARTLTAANHQAGDLYVTSDNRLFFCDGANWREVLLAAPESGVPPAAAARSSAGNPQGPVQPAPPPRP